MHLYSRCEFIKLAGKATIVVALPLTEQQKLKIKQMEIIPDYDVIIIGGSYSGLAAGMALGRALRKVLIIDSGKPCNRQTPHSHNFLTQDGKKPEEIALLAKEQVRSYKTVEFLNGLAVSGTKTDIGFEIKTASDDVYKTRKLIFATGILDVLTNIDGLKESWGISVLHCPYCHGYEVRDKATGILGNGEYGFEFVKLISNWTNDLTLFTNGKSELSSEQTEKIARQNIKIEERGIERFEHINGNIKNIVFKDGSGKSIDAVYTRSPFEQHCPIPQQLGCEITDEGFIKTDPLQNTTVAGVFACGDNASRMRTVANAVSMGTTAGMMVNKELVEEDFDRI
ncbi:MAG TPA: NAD(P)/FAD-dependent oxidoreductase [Chitinophagaceae bacterium]|nr:NAD(P)/FAD-dependent oxidoreductase [Chitinophagaceae bacterium]